MWMRIWRRMRRLQGSRGSGGQVMNQESDAREVGADGIVSPPAFYVRIMHLTWSYMQPTDTAMDFFCGK